MYCVMDGEVAMVLPPIKEEPKHEINWKAITVEDCELAANFGRMSIINDGMVVGFTPDEREVI